MLSMAFAILGLTIIPLIYILVYIYRNQLVYRIRKKAIGTPQYDLFPEYHTMLWMLSCWSYDDFIKVVKIDKASVFCETIQREPKKVNKTNNLIIRMKDGTFLNFSTDLWDYQSNIKPWIPFYKWFFGRTGDYYLMRHRTGEILIKRDNIDTFSVNIIES